MRQAAEWLRSGRVALAAGVLSVVLTALGARGDLWLDEVLSLQWAKAAKSPTDILVLYRHDNNHPLNTLWLYLLLKEGCPEWAYRALSIASGALLLWLLWVVAGRLTPRARVVPPALCGLSYVVIVLCGEARGYGPAMALALAGFAVLLTGGVRVPDWRMPVFWVLGILAVLAHATAVMPLAAMGIWALFSTRSLWRTAAWFAPPAAAFAGFAMFFLREMIVAGGPETSPGEVLRGLAAYSLGLPASPPWGWVALAAGAVLLVSGTGWGRFSVPGVRWCLGAAALAFPLIALLAAGDSYVHFRYAAVSLPFSALLVGGLVERLVEWHPRSATWVGVALGVFVLLQASRIAALLEHGRCSARRALAEIAAEGAGPGVVSSNHHMLAGMVFIHYLRMNPGLSAIKYAVETPPQPPDWLILAGQDDPMPAPAVDFPAFGAWYRLRRAFPSAPVSGAHWALYRRVEM